jgi:hypothetical protein
MLKLSTNISVYCVTKPIEDRDALGCNFLLARIIL